jgi:hypothetical protein
MLNTTLYTGSGFTAGAALCIRRRLFIAGWDLLPTLQRLKMNPRESRLAVGFIDQTPVALALFEKADRMVMAFCRKDARRNGYGSACVQALKLTFDEHGWAGEGIQGTHLFWQKNWVLVSRRTRFM